MKARSLIIIFLTASILCSVNLRGQTAISPGIEYADALTLYAAIFPQSNTSSVKIDSQAVRNILSYYCGKKIATYSQFETELNAFQNNLLLAYKDSLKKYLDTSGRAPFVVGIPAGNAPPSPGLNATNILEGLSQFLIARGQQELSMAFFTRFQKALVLYPELTYLFPKTCGLINKIENYNLLNLLQQLRDLFQKDLLNMPTNILSLRNMSNKDYDSAKCKKCGPRIEAMMKIINHPPAAAPIAGVLTIIQGIINGDNIITSLNKAAQDPFICSDPGNISAYIKLSSFVADALKTDMDGDGIFIADPKLRSVFNNNDQINLLLGLAYQQYIRMDCYTDTKFTIVLNGKSYHLKDIVDKMATTTGLVSMAFSDVSKINSNFTAIKANIKAGTTINFTNYGAMIDATFSFVDNVSKVIGGSILDKTNIAPELTILHNNLTTAVDFCTDVQQRNYSGIFNDIVKVINDNKIFDNETSKTVITYLSFGSNLASATTPDQVKNALEAVALPPGSYSIKQKSSFNISLNGYIGYNWDLSKGHGIYAPIGFAFSFGTDKVAGEALTLFGSIIDLGGIAAYQINNNNNTTDLKQDLTFESVISPSAQLFYEIPKWPLAVGFGWRMTPKLFYTGDGNLTTVKPESAWHISVLIDIPIFTLYNRPFK